MYARSLGTVNELEAAFGALWTQCQRCQGSLHQARSPVRGCGTEPLGGDYMLALLSALQTRCQLSWGTPTKCGLTPHPCTGCAPGTMLCMRV